MNDVLKKMVKEYEYPCIVLEVLLKFVDIVSNVLAGKRPGILLVGSTARGELCWAEINGKITLYSDIEFLLVANNMNRTCERELSEKIHQLSESYDLGKRFHFDYVVNKWSFLKNAQKKIFIFDSKNSGIDISKYPVKPHLPDVSRENLDFKELNDVLLHRMKSLLNDVPEDIFCDSFDFRTFALSLAKNTLDITTWLYPYEADYLVSGFKNRLEEWNKRKLPLELYDYLDESDFLFMEECIEIREKPAELINKTVDLLGKYIKIYTHSIEYCKKMNSISASRSLSENMVSSTLFLEYKIKRRLREGQIILMNTRIFSIKNILSNALLPRKGRQVMFCFDMLKSLHTYLSSEKNRLDNFPKIRKDLGKMIYLSEERCTGYKQNWLYLRDRYGCLNKVII